MDAVQQKKAADKVLELGKRVAELTARLTEARASSGNTTTEIQRELDTAEHDIAILKAVSEGRISLTCLELLEAQAKIARKSFEDAQSTVLVYQKMIAEIRRADQLLK